MVNLLHVLWEIRRSNWATVSVESLSCFTRLLIGGFMWVGVVVWRFEPLFLLHARGTTLYQSDLVLDTQFGDRPPKIGKLYAATWLILAMLSDVFAQYTLLATSERFHFYACEQPF